MQGPTYTAAELLARLVAFDTTSHKSNLRARPLRRGLSGQHGVVSHLVPTPDGEKASLFATIGPTDVPGIGLSGHTDVVPVDRKRGTAIPSPSSSATASLYGRGTADMKGYLACVLALVPSLHAAARSRRPSTSSSPTTRKWAAPASAR